jgi:hypothetical protein
LYHHVGILQLLQVIKDLHRLAAVAWLKYLGFPLLTPWFGYASARHVSKVHSSGNVAALHHLLSHSLRSSAA